MGTQEAIKNFETGKQVYYGLNTTSESKSACSTFRMLYVKSAQAVAIKTDTLSKKIKEIKEKYLPSVANPMINDLRKTYDAEIHDLQVKLSEKLDSALQAKREACRKYTMVPPSQDQLNLLQSIQLRGAENIPEAEWNQLIKTLAGNHQCASILEKFAKDSGKEFIAPFNAEKAMHDLDEFQNRAEIAINNIADPYKDGRAQEFYRDDIKDSLTSELINKLDSEIGTTVPDPNLTLKGRLEAAANNALKKGHADEFQMINQFKWDHVKEIEATDEKYQEIHRQAEDLIALGMSAKEMGKDPIEQYNKHREAVLALAGKLNYGVNNGSK